MPKKAKKIEDLLFKPATFWESASRQEIHSAMDFCDGYKQFLNEAKTERQVIAASIKLASKEGFKEVSLDEDLGKNRKLIFVNRAKALAMVDLGEHNLNSGVKILLAHVDAPHLDLKVRPLYEDSGIAYFKPHYYGGIKKYHWPTTPLAMSGMVVLKNGEEIEINIGGKKDEPVFLISDLLPHLEKERLDKPFDKAIEAEELNIIVGSIPVSGKKTQERVKLAVLAWLSEHYRIKEVDLLAADIRFVPAYEARDVGLDKSMIGGYGQDDRVCVYTTLRAFLASKDKGVKILYLADKEEIGSVGTTGAESLWLENVVDYLLKQTKSNISLYDLFRKSWAISADVTAAFDPDYKSAYDKNNSAELGKGAVIEKYLGYKGKYMTVDAEPKYLRHLMDLFDKKRVVWQTGHLGKVDQGGGSTIAVYLANRNLEVVDLGVPLLNMHAPYELSSKADVYSAYKGYRVFLEGPL
ncbi:aminopeptidase [Candidatus Kuenenbacteria bacterium CG_4_9_14_3_um_filter_39_14]|uniref:M18 family aminopeptidase n=2 Tax=Candidatus Kueneniibacteriota TaxID=1752740 RepID=A0A2H0U6G1_9BACT|nr:MAG: aminopeptidase [Candidatus Kuenenbacteria bacterium CG10_big_fil_rev_8_21_14_0_10_39_14]PJA91696.1 MAG: aminopeptidase [Candidatus Kuenenbacteria bacterium CG_4_9_14_3_um_filter_39_14]